MARLTPNIKTKGPFTFKAPFVAMPDVDYLVVGLRQFAELSSNKDFDPFVKIYAPVGLTQTDMNLDIADGVTVVVFADNIGQLVYVPDSYILDIPHKTTIPYSNLIASFSFGLLPDDEDVSVITENIASSAAEVIGVKPEVFITRSDLEGTVTEEQHLQLVTSRQAAITNRETDRAAVIRLSNELLTLKAQLAEYELIMQEMDKALPDPTLATPPEESLPPSDEPTPDETNNAT